MTQPPVLARTRADLAAALAAAPGTRAVVMTMGALHAGHLALVREARRRAERVVVTIFVNPLQFGPSEDFARYPRDLDRDLERLAGEGVDVVFAPPVEEMYPAGDPVVRVSAGALGAVLEGAARPGHFDGVLTVVLKLLGVTGADVALFGQKDAQQLVAVRRMVADLDLGVEIVAVPTVREPDGLARSSRNAYLAPDERARALALHRALAAGADAAGRGAAAVRAAAQGVLADAPGVDVEYLALVAPADLAAVGEDYGGPAILAVAARVGATRLIDNVPVTLAQGASAA